MKLILAAHPDDESIACASLLLADPAGCLVVHATDGAPRNPYYWEKHGFKSRESYRQARLAELTAALDLAGVPAAHRIRCEIADQDVMLEVETIASRLLEIIRDHGVTALFTHAYEGGHPDHDACAAAAARLAELVELFEFPLYHQAPGHYVAGHFIGAGGHEVELTQAEQKRKVAMLRCFKSQISVMDRFESRIERFRPAPRYDFTQPPHPGTLYYETRPMGTTFTRWRESIHALK